MQDTVDPATAPPRTLAQIIENAPRGLYRFKRSQRRTFISLRARGTAAR